LQVFCVTCGPSNPLYYGKGPREAVMDSEHRRLFSERAIPLHANIYVMGQAREREDVVAPEIARDQHAPMFLISTRSETQIRSGLNKQFWVFCVLGWLLCIGGCLLQDRLVEDHRANDFVTYQPVVKVEQGSQKHLYWPPQWRQERPNRAFYTNSYVIVGSSYLATWLIGWTWMAFNSMVDLRRRVDQAWANVDVELKRRHDLLPNLVRTTEGLRDYERHLQTELAALRAQLVATAPGVPGPDPEGCAMHVRAIIERYPELKADGAFLSLQKSLVETEQRIALARGYFNEIATFYNTRLQIVPDGWIARLGFMKPQPLISATNFERSELSVNLADLAGSAGRKDGRNQ
ncbi:MAG TPA: LemA family protein, partial [Phycisphaerae bacterium]|nr:LemA family protein [Phycisphaerae bacterium]